jgi:hypothetical protein
MLSGVTAQISDQVHYREKVYDLVGIDGYGLFDPADEGLTVRMISTACWRGYICVYRVVDDRLLLTALALGMDSPPDELFGATPLSNRHGETWYGPIAVPVNFTGGLLLGAGFLRELYVHMGFHPAWKYRCVYELIFDHGRLVAAYDRSEAIAQRRAAQGALQPEREEDVTAWVEETFDRSYHSPL